MKRLSLMAASAVLLAATTSNVQAGAGCSGPNGCPSTGSTGGSCGRAHGTAAACATSPSGSTASLNGTHTVVRGESLSKIAQTELGNSRCWNQIARANNLRSPYVIRVGQVLRMPNASECSMHGSRQTSVSSTDANYNTNPGTLRQLWVKPVQGGLPANNAPVGSQLHREWTSQNNILATGVADRIGPPPTAQTVVVPAEPKPAPLGSAAPVPFGTGAAPVVVAPTSGNPVQDRPRP